MRVIGFYTKGLTFNGNTVNEKGLGGSESAIVYIAREFAKNDNEVIVFCHCDRTGVYDGVLYLDIDASYSDAVRNYNFDIFISSRFTYHLFSNPVKSNLMILWLHDIPYETMSHWVEYLWQIDRVYVLSQYHRDLFIQKYPQVSNKLGLISNGFDLDLVNTVNAEVTSPKDRLNHFVYASRPERGLRFLLERVWPAVINQNPKAVLHIAGYETHDKTFALPDLLLKEYDEIDKIASQTPQVIMHGSLPKKKWYILLKQCGFMLYPTDFPEIFCINVVEAQALGCIPITSRNFAFLETVKDNNLLIPHSPAKEPARYVEEILYITT